MATRDRILGGALRLLFDRVLESQFLEDAFVEILFVLQTALFGFLPKQKIQIFKEKVCLDKLSEELAVVFGALLDAFELVKNGRDGQVFGPEVLHVESEDLFLLIVAQKQRADVSQELEQPSQDLPAEIATVLLLSVLGQFFSAQVGLESLPVESAEGEKDVAEDVVRVHRDQQVVVLELAQHLADELRVEHQVDFQEFQNQLFEVKGDPLVEAVDLEAEVAQVDQVEVVVAVDHALRHEHELEIVRAELATVGDEIWSTLPKKKAHSSLMKSI